MKYSGHPSQSAETHYKAKSLLDQILDNYDRTAQECFRRKNELEKAPEDVRDKRAKELKEIQRVLELQRMSAECMATVQAGLDAYRQYGRDATKGTRTEVVQKQKVLMAEEHHPTKQLEANMLAAIDPKPGPGHTAHHIVPGRGKTKFANLARVHMHRFAVRINDPDNGVWLPTYKKHTPSFAMPEAKGHLQYHTENYEQWLSLKLRAKMSENFVRTELRLVANMLQTNQLPKEARAKQ